MKNIGPHGSPESTAPFAVTSDWGRFALGYALLWGTLLLMSEAGAGDLAAALAVTIAGGMTVVAGANVTHNLGLGKG